MAKKGRKAGGRAKKAAKKAERNVARKPGRPVKKKAAAKALGPVQVKTGRGKSPLELGTALVERFNRGEMDLTDDWSKAIESVEGIGTSMAWRGRKAVDAKNAWWMSDHAVHGASAEGPYVGATGFAVKFRMDVETKSTGKREWMEEIGAYTVRDGKIVREEFMGYAPATPAASEVPAGEQALARM